MKYTTEFDLGELVYIKTDIHQYERIVIGIGITGCGMTYTLNFETTESVHYAFEITRERDIVKRTSN